MVRPRMGRMIGGVCQGLANQYNWDVAWVRVLAVVLAVFGGRNRSGGLRCLVDRYS